MAKLPRYCYKPLETLMTIRVLVLNAATSVNEPLTCAIEHQQRDSATADYCAISYAWGVPNFTHQLLLSSGADVAHLAITKNVDGLLRQMRSLDIRRLWIDAVCLNQDDKTEKSRQIPEMGAIYRCANMVHIWLGESDEAAEAAFELFKTYGRGNDLSEWSLGGLLREFAERPWFHRRWVIQEACLSRRPLLHCGKLRLPLSALVSATQQLAMNVRTYQKIETEY
ncbi:heterokaryon incompatibility protein-domain-containing protein [Microdochium bolleyi]|uniref:Heterokaryon incompatibility protein-domain-containing protein n=1 Tax=Microdochium bolleyi TaxID=196109 RepID=A0A136IRW7_9PEZI|nr:heterokaryon incompatibility protein-domain-containing protein [Microdochium bolleyi]